MRDSSTPVATSPIRNWRVIVSAVMPGQPQETNVENVSKTDMTTPLPIDGTHSVTGRFGFDLSWYREYDSGRLEGGRGLRLRADHKYQATFTSDGQVHVDTPGVSSAMETQLVLALLGISPVEWVNAMPTLMGTRQWQRIVEDTGVSGPDMQIFQSNWSELGYRGQAELWWLTGQPNGLSDLARSIASRSTAQLPEWTTSIWRPLERILQSPFQRQVLFYFREHSMWHQDLAMLEDAFQDESRSGRLPEWVRNRLASLLAANTGDVGQKLTERLKLVRPLALRILAMARQSIANSMQYDWQIQHAGASPSEFAKRTNPDRYVSVHLPMHYRKLMSLQSIDWTGLTLVEGGNECLLLCRPEEDLPVRWSETAAVHVLTTPLRHAQPGEAMNPKLRFSYTRPAPEWSDPYWRHLLAAYGFDGDLTRSESTLQVDLEMDWFLAWSRFPTAKEKHYQSTSLSMSRSVQTYLRMWIPALYFAQPEALADRPEALPYMAYNVMEPCGPRNRGKLTYEAMDPHDHQRALRSCGRRLHGVIDRSVRALREISREDIAREYLELTAGKIVRALNSRPRRIAPFFSLESCVVEELMRLSERTHELRHVAQSPTPTTLLDVQRFAEQMMCSINRKIKHALGYDGSFLMPFLFIAATQPLIGLDPIRHPVTVILENGGNRYVLRPPTHRTALLAVS